VAARGPTIAVSSGFTDYGDYLGVALSRPLLAAGGVPFVLPYAEDAEARGRLLDRVDGLLLGFGRDIDPARYGREPHPAMTDVSPERDAIELALVAEALERGLPVLGICRGMQVLNVAAGGSLIQDLPSQVPVALPHALDETTTTVAHGLEVIDGTHLARAVSAGMSSHVNSRHHQAAKVLGGGLAVSAYAPDGIVEAIEARDLPFCVGVQWHPENFWQTGEFRGLFDAFIAAARERT
jgi:putative glutamine amidotransferase